MIWEPPKPPLSQCQSRHYYSDGFIKRRSCIFSLFYTLTRFYSFPTRFLHVSTRFYSFPTRFYSFLLVALFTKRGTAYNERCIQIEHGSFTPLVFSAFGGSGRETSQFISKLIEKLSEKNGMESSVVANYLRTKVSFELVRSQVDCIRGSRSMKKIQFNAQDIEIQETKIVE